MRRKVGTTAGPHNAAGCLSTVESKGIIAGMRSLSRVSILTLMRSSDLQVRLPTMGYSQREPHVSGTTGPN